MSALLARTVSRLDEIEPAAWDRLHDGSNPFVHHAFLAGLERHGCIQAEWGWTPRHLTLWRDGALVAGAPGYLKENSHGEFVFDHAWARAYASQGLEYFPKHLYAVPYSPVTGPRLLASDDAGIERALVDAMADDAARMGRSSAHVNFHPESQRVAFKDASTSVQWLARIDVQYHWSNHGEWADFADFLAALSHKRRKNIRQERARVAAAGVSFRIVDGATATAEDLQQIHGFYLQTFAEYGNHPALTLPFLHHLAATMPRSLVLFFAERDGRPIAGALCLRGGDTLYGRYWGSIEAVPGLHFETCYYQGIEYCLREGLSHFEPGAQGEHKLARGFLPVFVHSHHWIAEPVFRDALRQWCGHEAESVRAYARTLSAHSPFKQGDAGQAADADLSS
ncbi:GNAT family N-acetyltransferase [Novilysobacter antarcticus]|uniref:GNAT family N-acetyltransferase n=1 Tax=Novilysobacter antarcticus TaxID=2862543 RepID=UPI001C992CAF|nr:GNAT family N-acetyltransferase [Lysobacter antarcticus]